MSQLDPARLGRAIVENFTGHAIFGVDPAGTISSWNPGVQRLFGYERDEFVGASAEMLFTCDDRRSGALQARLGMARREGASTGTVRLVRNNGELIDAHIDVCPVSEHGQLQGFAIMIRRSSPAPEELAPVALNLTHAFVRTVEGAILLWTDGAHRLYGWTRQEAEGKIASELLCTAAEIPEKQIVRHVLEHGEWQGGLSHRRRDGSTVFLASHWILHRGPAGEPPAIVEVNNDITLLMQSEKDRDSLFRQLIDTQARIEAIVRQLPLGIAIAKAPGGELMIHNEEAIRLLRHPIDRSKSIEEYAASGALHEDGRPYAPEDHPLALALSGQVVKKHEMLYRRGDGTITHLLADAGPIRDNAGNVIGAVTTFEDVSERKQAEEERERLVNELRRSNEDLSQFAHTVSHDLQEPLRTMRSYSDLLLRRYASVLDESGLEFVRYIAMGAERMDELVQALLQYARAGGARLSLEPVGIDTIVDAAITNLEPQIEECGGQVECAELPVLNVDAVQMTQVFQNLIGNALKYRTPDVPPVIRISAHRRRGAWTLSVADNGVGIPSVHHLRVFSPLKRLHGASIPGSGMGLAICRKIVQRHGGDIWVESKTGEGATFRFTIPQPD